MLKKTQFARVEVGRRSGGQLATMLVATKSNIIFFRFPIPPPQLSSFLIEEVLGSKKFI